MDNILIKYEVLFRTEWNDYGSEVYNSCIAYFYPKVTGYPKHLNFITFKKFKK